jgi:hypothetical protein
MLALLIVLLVLVVELAIIGGIMYFFWKKWGKSLFNMLKTLTQTQNLVKNNKKLPKIDDFKEQMKLFNDILNNYKKK